MTDKTVALDILGEVLMSQVRDKSIKYWLRVLDKQGAASHLQAIYKMLEGFSDQQLEIVKYLLVEIVDGTIAELLNTVENSGVIDFSVKTPNGVISETWEESDGLSVEPLGDNGWIAKFSKYRRERER